MEKVKVIVEKEVSLEDISRFLIDGIKNKFVGKKANIRTIVKEVKSSIFEMLGEYREVDVEKIKKLGWITKLFLKTKIIPKSSQYFFIYHLFFPTIQTRTKNGIISYNIDDLTVYRLSIPLTEGVIKIRLKYNYSMSLTKVTYRIIRNEDNEMEDYDEDI